MNIRAEAVLGPRIPAVARRGYGYGWHIAELEDRRTVGHLGGIEGVSAGIARFVTTGPY